MPRSTRLICGSQASGPYQHALQRGGVLSGCCISNIMLCAHAHVLGTAALLQAYAYSETAIARTLYSGFPPACKPTVLPPSLIGSSSFFTMHLAAAAAESSCRHLHTAWDLGPCTANEDLVPAGFKCPLHACTCLR